MNSGAVLSHSRGLLPVLLGLSELAIAGPAGPDSATLLRAQKDDSNWILPVRTYAGNRYETSARERYSWLTGHFSAAHTRETS